MINGAKIKRKREKETSESATSGVFNDWITDQKAAEEPGDTNKCKTVHLKTGAEDEFEDFFSHFV